MMAIAPEKAELTYCKMMLGGTKMLGLIDGGATVSLIREDQLKELKKKQFCPWKQGPISGSTPGERQIRGSIKVELRIGDVTKWVQLGIVEEFPYKLLHDRQEYIKGRLPSHCGL